ncbi:Competence protein F-like phosphoribosyltransferase domain protein YhgH required for utilization of DNA as sole source of carbon and energy [Paramagnetospirillum magnetotacticum MS-1]|uniref:Competence protein F-like phosphoribosyltransferase domain protein YhgH required for utilization of DNA as sole source of carbon and energy n=1 Tax=Paramagnetospirillum magnetotacticum MS-1 TaxID=272627 RepID=A0A0C2YKG2_PARME|nr:ComF family protein [Paramagnetospirillum magnetotacticum]KIM00265.1 Competence protein F-like phosphoribosyltransferase domain protein YhgH required for utilization of DNA as sole source of carbon and energy [Paramagnetospirillum magnetotacticum MS-1]
MPVRIARLVIDALLPPLCLSCQAEVAEPGSLCPACWSGMVFLGEPSCACCGLPFEFDPGDGVICGECARVKPRYARARAVFRYDDSSKALVLRFKHGDRLEGVGAFARWMARAGGVILAQADLLVPVPLHRWRLLSRRYNQAALLAVAIGKLTQVAVEPGMLTRTRRTPPQGHLGHDARARNVAGAFRVDDRLRPRLDGRRVVLIDDVMTSGATVGECARVLLKAGAVCVDVLTLGRVVREG